MEEKEKEKNRTKHYNINPNSRYKVQILKLMDKKLKIIQTLPIGSKQKKIYLQNNVVYANKAKLQKF